MLWLLLCPALQATTIGSGQPLSNAAALHVPAGGFVTLGEVLGALVPESYTISGMTGDLSCEEDSDPLHYELENLVLFIEVTRSDIVPGDKRLDLWLSLDVTASADALRISGDCLLPNLVDECPVSITSDNPITLSAHVGITLDILPDGTIRANADMLEATLGAIPNPFGDCGLGAIIDTLNTYYPGTIDAMIQEYFQAAVADGLSSINDALAESLTGVSLAFATSFALGEATVDLALAPSSYTLDATGLTVGLGTTLSASPMSDCVDPGEGSEATAPGLPEMGELAWDDTTAYDLGIFVNKDLLDNLLWNVWATGLLCMDLTDLQGTALTTDLLGLLYGEDYKALFPESSPASLSVLAAQVPTSRFDDEVPIWIDIEGLQVDTASILEDRWLRVAGMSVDGSVGLEPNLTSTSVAPALVIDTEAFTFTETFSDLLTEGWSQTVADMLPGLLDTFLPEDLLPAYDIPTWQGVALDEVTWIPDDDGQWLGAFATLDVEAVEPIALPGCQTSVGCDDSGGCDTGSMGCDASTLGCDEAGCGSEGCGDTSGCSDSGCVTSRPLRIPARPFLFLGLGLVALLRRRR